MRYVVGFLIGIGLIVLTFILIFKAFSGGGNDAPKTQAVDLNSYANTNAIVRYTIDGPLESNSEHHRVRITVARDQVSIEQIEGYQGKLVLSKSYPNNPDSYANFLHALTIAGYEKVDKNKPTDERGYCPLGRRYIYEAIDGGDTVLRSWSTSCGSLGNFSGGKADTIRSLFMRQVPDYNTLDNNFDV